MSESAPKSTIVLDVDAQGVTTGVNAAKKSLKELGDSAKGVGGQFEDAGKQAERGFDGIEKKAVATKRTTDALVNQLKNSIIDLKAAGDAASKYELRAIDKGIPANVYAPYVAQLRALQVEQAAAAASAAAASNSIARTMVPTLEKTGMTAKATAAALRSVPAQFTDIVVSLQGGQAPLTVLLQQGGQLKDMFGGVGEAARALGGYIKGLINPYTVAAAAVGSLYLAYSQGAAETEAFNKALILSGNQAGTTAVKLSAMAQSVSASTGSTVGAAAAALATLAGTSGIATAQFEKISAVAIGMEKTTGKAVAETVKQFVELGKSPVDASVKLNESTNYLTLSVYEQIKALEEQGRTLEAGVVAQNAYADAMSQRIPQLVDNLGYAEAAWKAIGSAAKKAWDDFLGVGRKADPVDEMSNNIAAAQAKLQMRQGEFNNAKGYDRVGTGADLAAQQKIVDGLLQEQDALLEIERIKGRSNAADADRLAVVNAKAAFDKRGEAYLDKAAKMQRALNVEIEASRLLLDKGAISAAEYAKRLTDVQAQFAEKPKTPRVDRKDDFADFMRDMDKAAEMADRENASNTKLAASEKFRIENMYKLAKLYKEREISSTQLAAAEARLNAVADKAAGVERIQAQVKAQELLNEQRKKELLAMAGSVTKLEQKAQAAEDEIAMYGKGAEAIEALSIARLQENRDIVAGFGASQEMLDLLDQEIDARKRIAKATDTKKGLDENKKAAEKAADEWQKTADKINDTLTDALMRGFEDGKGFAENMRDTIVNMFKTMVLRPTIQAVLNPIAQSITGALNVPKVPGTGSGLSAFSDLTSLAGAGYQALTGSLAGASSASLLGANAVGAVGGDALGALIAANGQWAGVSTVASAGSVGAAGTAAGVGSGIASSLAAAGPYLAAAAAVIAIAKSFDDSGTYHSGGTGSYSADKGVGYGASAYSFGLGGSEYRQDANVAAGQVAMAVSSIIDTAAGIAGSSAKSFVGTGYADDSSGDGAWGGLLIRLGDQMLTDWERGADKWPGREFADGAAGQKQYLDAIAQDVRKAIDTIGLPEWAEKYIDALGDGAGLEGLAQALEKIKLTEAAFVTLGDVFTGLADLSDGAKTQLLKVSGGIEALAGVASAYYDNFYTAEEKAARLTGQTAEAFAKLGLVMPAINDATRSNYRALIDELAAKDLSIEANAKAYAGALSLQGAMNELAPTAEAAAASIASAARTILDAFTTDGVINFDGLLDSLSKVGVESFVATIGLVFENLAKRIGSVLDGIAAERIAVRETALQIMSPDVMTKAAIERGISSINTALPAGSAVGASAALLSDADAKVLAAQAASAAAKTRLSSAGAMVGDQQQNIAAIDAAFAKVTATFKSFTDYRDWAWSGAGRYSESMALIEPNRVKTAQYSADTAAYQAQRAAAEGQLGTLNGAYSASAAEAANYASALAAQQAVQAAATAAAKQALLDYASAVQDFAIDASKSVDKLTQLREETIKYYDAQKALADLMGASAANLRGAVTSSRSGQFDTAQSIAQQQELFASAYSMALSTTGADQAGYADKLTAVLPGLSAALMETSATREDWARATGSLFAQSETIAGQLEANAPKDYAADSLALLGQIDATLLALDASSKSAERIIADAVNSGSEKTAGGLRAVIAAISGAPIPAFASGGSHLGGLRLVGERGPELEVTGPSRIYSASQTAGMLGGSGEMLQELRALRQEVAGLRAEAQATAGHTSKTARLLDRAMPDGDALSTRIAA